MRAFSLGFSILCCPLLSMYMFVFECVCCYFISTLNAFSTEIMQILDF